MRLEMSWANSFVARSEGNQQPGAEVWERSTSGSSGWCGSWRKMDLGMRRGRRVGLRVDAGEGLQDRAIRGCSINPVRKSGEWRCREGSRAQSHARA